MGVPLRGVGWLATKRSLRCWLCTPHHSFPGERSDGAVNPPACELPTFLDMVDFCLELQKTRSNKKYHYWTHMYTIFCFKVAKRKNRCEWTIDVNLKTMPFKSHSQNHWKQTHQLVTPPKLNQHPDLGKKNTAYFHEVGRPLPANCHF